MASSIAFFGIAVLGISKWGSFGLSVSIRVVGGIISVAGAVIVTMAIGTLGSKTTQGLGGKLIDSGLYRWSRNPQYLGDILLLIGFAVLTDSASTFAACVGASGCLWLTPQIEEPWLMEQLGSDYSEYNSRVPRFIGFPRR